MLQTSCSIMISEKIKSLFPQVSQENRQKIHNCGMHSKGDYKKHGPIHSWWGYGPSYCCCWTSGHGRWCCRCCSWTSGHGSCSCWPLSKDDHRGIIIWFFKYNSMLTITQTVVKFKTISAAISSNWVKERSSKPNARGLSLEMSLHSLWLREKLRNSFELRWRETWPDSLLVIAKSK